MEKNTNKRKKSLDRYVNDLDGLIEQFPQPLHAHSRRVAICCSVIAAYAKDFLHLRDFTKDTDIEEYAFWGGTFHDIGKLLFPSLIMSRADYIRHPEVGADFLEKHKTQLFKNENQAQYVIEVVRYHHIQPDGKGFPGSSKSEYPSVLAWICSVTDRLDHMLYSKPDFQIDSNNPCVLANINKQAGTVFFSTAVICVEKAWPQLMKHYTNWNRRAKQ